MIASHIHAVAKMNPAARNEQARAHAMSRAGRIYAARLERLEVGLARFGGAKSKSSNVSGSPLFCAAARIE